MATCRSLPLGPLGVLLAVAAAAQPRYVRYQEAAPLLPVLREVRPPGLAVVPDERLAATWPGWVVERDRAVRQRLARGEQDTVVNLLFFGTCFTRAPRLTAETLRRLGPAAEALLARRLQDLTAALAGAGGDERVVLARAAMGISAGRDGRPLDRRAIERRLLEAVARVRQEQAAFAGEVARIRQIGDATQQMALRSTLFRERGIALDTSLRPAFAVEEALREALERGLLVKGGVRRVAVVGPGLDLVDKGEGQDFYPPQSLQAVALADSLLRLGLARAKALSISALDISPRVLDHLTRARGRAQAGLGYELQLPRPTEGWGKALVGYWERFGDAIAVPAEPVRPPPSAGGVVVRAVQVRPEVAALVEPMDLNIVYQRLDKAPDERYDLVVATNILVYYDTFEQCLALANLAAMMQVGGLFLANSAVLELPDSRLRSVGYTTVVYSEGPEDGEHLIFYRRLPDVP